MAKTISVRVSSAGLETLKALSKSSGLTRDAALSWVLVETAVPVVPKRGRARNEPLTATISDAAYATLDAVATSHEASQSLVVEAYLVRGID
jgi:hypothetical protein